VNATDWEPGSELDTLVATHLLGWRLLAGVDGAVWVDREGKKQEGLPAFSGDIGVAWRVFEAVRRHSPEATVRFLAEIPSLGEVLANPSDSAALMICQAALRAIENKER
jgi:hypothetical protein